MGEWHEKLINKYIPASKDNFKSDFDKCHMRKYHKDENLVTEINDPRTINFTLVKCNKWVYSKEYFEATLNTEV